MTRCANMENKQIKKIIAHSFIRLSKESVKFSWSNFRHRYTWRETRLLARKYDWISCSLLSHSQPLDVLMTPSRVNRCWRHPLSRLSKRDPLISPQNNPPQTLSSHSLAIPLVPSRNPLVPLPPLTFCRRWLLSRSAHWFLGPTSLRCRRR